MEATKIERRGGVREGAGPPFAYGEATCNLTVRIPASRKEEVREMIKQYLLQYRVNAKK
jgi:hypothetical protein